MRELERRVLLSVMDRKWREHLYEMDYLQEGIGLRAMGQRDPLVEYQREGFDMFGAMMEAIKEESVGFLFNVEVQVQGGEAGQAAVQAGVPTAAPAADLVATGPGEAPGEVQVERLEPSTPDAEPAPVGVAGSPVPSEAPASTVEEPSLAAESPQPPTPVQGPGAGTTPPAPAAPAPAAPLVPAAPAARAVLPEAFGRPEQPQRVQYTGPTVDGEAGRSGVASSAGPVGETAGPPGHGSRDQSRNSLCFCGSGKKYKRCHGDPRNVAS
jgi:preprotein translocase subunit SecA